MEINPDLDYYKGKALLNRHTKEWVYPDIVEALVG